MSTRTDVRGARVLVTGGAGFLGEILSKRLLAADSVIIGGQNLGPIEELAILDLALPRDDVSRDPRVRSLTGELAESLATMGAVDCIFHLAGVVSSAAEADFNLGMRTNVDGTIALLEYARNLSHPPILVFASSLAVYGSDPAVGAVGGVDDNTMPRPQSSYGTQKFIGELLVADYTRKGYLRGRSVRLMTVSVRPGAPNAAASSFLSGIIREPLAGLPAICPVDPEIEIALSSPERTMDGILKASEVDDDAWGSRTAMNLPALTTTPGDMAEALDRVSGKELSSLIEWAADPAVAAIVESWPARFVTDRARNLGLEPEASFDNIVRAYMASAKPSVAR
ncbi:D-erythronate dehydrogenase [Pseudarthrobacter oxydans]|uniref:D-erythronate dehydrogenase n=1 Tax=Pseudarthrobacter oxydans TaxID=1671 RepID=UPI003808788E